MNLILAALSLKIREMDAICAYKGNFLKLEPPELIIVHTIHLQRSTMRPDCRRAVDQRTSSSILVVDAHLSRRETLLGVHFPHVEYRLRVRTSFLYNNDMMKCMCL